MASSRNSGYGQRATLHSVAEAAGVHPSTVSRVLNRDANSRVTIETAERIRRVANTLGYEPNHAARGLRTGRTHALGVLIPRLTDMVLSTMVEAASTRARVAGYQTITVSTRDQHADQRELVESLLDRGVDGLILATARLDDDLPSEVRDRGIPLVLMNRLNGDFPSISGDDELGGFLATVHLIELGHRRVGIVAGPAGVSTGEQRLSGYRRAHAEQRIAVREELVVHSTFSAEGGEVAGSQLLDLPDPPTAIFAVNDFAAIGVMAAAKARGRSIPEDLAVVGYNDISLSSRLHISLSSVALPMEEMGRLAVEMLLSALQGHRPDSMLMIPQLHIRQSSSPPADAVRAQRSGQHPT